MYTKQTVALTSAQILASNTTAITALAAKTGIGYAVKQLRVSRVKDSTETTQYATNTSMKLKYSGGDDIATIDLSALPATDNDFEVIIPVSHTATKGAAIVLQTDTGDPVTGTIPVNVVIEHEIVL